jgi:general nucleoside transport system permease protein
VSEQTVDPAADPQAATASPDEPPEPTGFWRRLTASSLIVTVLAFVAAMLLGGILIAVADPRTQTASHYFFQYPWDTFQYGFSAIWRGYVALFEGAFFNPHTASKGTLAGYVGPISETLTNATPLILGGLSVGLAFRAGLFNIGGQGQVIMGCIGGALAGFLLPLPVGLHLVAAILGAALGGGIWALIAGYLKARTGAHEVIVTIMLNYVALYFLYWLINVKGVHDPTRTDAISRKVDQSARMPLLSSGQLRLDLGLPLALAAAAAMVWLLERSTVGFEMRAVGANPDAARTAGMSVGRAYVLSMTVAGALAGIGGGMLVFGSSGLGNTFALTDAVGGSVGFDGITVALLGRGRPWGVVASALLFGALHAGGNRMQQTAHVAIDLVTVIQALIVIFIAAPALVRATFRLRASRTGGAVAGLAKGW